MQEEIDEKEEEKQEPEEPKEKIIIRRLPGKKIKLEIGSTEIDKEPIEKAKTVIIKKKK